MVNSETSAARLAGAGRRWTRRAMTTIIVVLALAVARNSKAYSGGHDGTLRVWSHATGAPAPTQGATPVVTLVVS